MNVQDSIKMALEIGIDTTGGTSRNAEGMEGIQTVSSDEVEAFRSAFKQCNENSKTIIFDVLEDGAAGAGEHFTVRRVRGKTMKKGNAKLLKVIKFLVGFAQIVCFISFFVGLFGGFVGVLVCEKLPHLQQPFLEILKWPLAIGFWSGLVTFVSVNCFD